MNKKLMKKKKNFKTKKKVFWPFKDKKDLEKTRKELEQSGFEC
jgi:hypothetical protein